MTDTIVELALLATISISLFVVFSLATVIALPTDFFHEKHNVTATQNKYTYAARLPIGVLALAGGLVMLVTPGPGILFCLLGFALMKNKHPKTALVHLVNNYNLVSKFNRVRRFFKRKPFTLSHCAHNKRSTQNSP